MAEDVTIYHNPRCSKSRQTLALLEQNSIEATIVLYLETPPSPKEIKGFLTKLGMDARELLRKGEEQYKALGLNDLSLSDNMVIEAMSANPKLIERPIVTKGHQAVLGRPPENVLELINQ